MRTQFSKFAWMAGIMLALAFTFSCSSDGDGGDGDYYYYSPNNEYQRCRSGVFEIICGYEWYNGAKYACLQNTDADGNINYYTMNIKQFYEQYGYVRCGNFYYQPDYPEFQRCQSRILEIKSGDAWITYEQSLEQHGYVRCR